MLVIYVQFNIHILLFYLKQNLEKNMFDIKRINKVKLKIEKIMLKIIY